MTLLAWPLLVTPIAAGPSVLITRRPRPERPGGAANGRGYSARVPRRGVTGIEVSLSALWLALCAVLVDLFPDQRHAARGAR